MSRIKYANKDHFLALARYAEKEGFNRQVHWEKLYDDMDPEGTNLVTFTMLHEHKGGCLTDPHIRTRWMLKMRGTMEPVEVFLDISMQNFEALPELEYSVPDGSYRSERMISEQ